MVPATHKSAFVSFALTLLLLAYAFRTVSRRATALGVGAVHSNTNTTGCYKFGKGIPAIEGCEDIHVDSHTGLAYLACGNRAARTVWLHRRRPAKTGKDRVLVMDGSNNLLELHLAEHDRTSGRLVPFSQEFRVHGFDIYRDSLHPGELTFMFVNHQQSGPGISIFRHTTGTRLLRHVKTVKSPLLHAPNDVVATSRNTFYATNDMRSTVGLLRAVEIFFGMPWGHVVHYSHEGIFSVAASGIPYPNGIVRSADGRMIYMAASSEPSVGIFRPAADGTLEPLGKTVFRDFIPDNLSVDEATGHVLVAGFLNTYEMFRYNREVLGGTTARPAGGVRRLRPLPDPRKGFSEEGVLVHDGGLLPSTTVAALQRRGRSARIILGSVMADHIAICRVVN